MEGCNERCTTSAKLHVNKITQLKRTEIVEGKARENQTRELLHFFPHILKLKKPFPSVQPLCSFDCALGKATARFRVVAQIDLIQGRVERELMHSDNLAFAERSYLDNGSAILLQKFLHGCRCTRRSVFLLRVMPFVDVGQIPVVRSEEHTSELQPHSFIL